MAVNYNLGLSVFIPSLGASHWNDYLLNPIGKNCSRLLNALIPNIKLDCFSYMLRGDSWVTLGEKKEWQQTDTLQPWLGVKMFLIMWILTKHLLKCELERNMLVIYEKSDMHWVKLGFSVFFHWWVVEAPSDQEVNICVWENIKNRPIIDL